MKNKFSYTLACLLLFIVLLNSFISDNPYFSITQKDVEVHIPKGFPKPVYDFKKNKITPIGFILGRKLFHDPILSKDSSISCAFCHQRFAAFGHMDHQLSHGINGLIGKRNVPALQNLIWNKNFMWDGGVNHLDLQPLAPLSNPLEMGETLANVLKKLQRNKEYVSLFKKVFNDSVITSENFFKAISQFTALLISADSRYDKYKNGKDTLSKQELRGLKLFRANCATCHQEPLFTDNSYRNNGLTINNSLRDSGRLMITGIKTDYLKFKVPSLRNVEMTYPYMHDGRYGNLNEVLNHYTKDFSSNKTIDPFLQKGIKLNEQEKKDVIAFLKTLTDKTFLYDRRFADPNFDVYAAPKKIIPKKDAELVKQYEIMWDTVRLNKKGLFPQYETHRDDLEKIQMDIFEITRGHTKEFPELEKLRLKFIAGKKYRDAITNYITLGQPASVDEITWPCVDFLQKNFKDAKIINKQLKGSSKKGWVVEVSYKTKTEKVEKKTFEVKYNPIEKKYSLN